MPLLSGDPHPFCHGRRRKSSASAFEAGSKTTEKRNVVPLSLPRSIDAPNRKQDTPRWRSVLFFCLQSPHCLLLLDRNKDNFQTNYPFFLRLGKRCEKTEKISWKNRKRSCNPKICMIQSGRSLTGNCWKSERTIPAPG